MPSLPKQIIFTNKLLQYKLKVKSLFKNLSSFIFQKVFYMVCWGGGGC